MNPQAYSYTPGSVVAICGGRVTALVDLPADAGLVAGLHELAGDAAAGLDDVLELLVSPGLRAVESFALAEFTDEGLRTVVRGRFRARAGAQTIEGRGLWTDRIVQADAFILLDPDAAGGPSLPLAAGAVVLAGQVHRRSGNAAPRLAAPVSSPPRPDPEPEPRGDQPAPPGATHAPAPAAAPLTATDAPAPAAAPPTAAPNPALPTAQDAEPFAPGGAAAAAEGDSGQGGTGHTLPTPFTSPLDALPARPPSAGEQPTFIDSLPWTSPPPGEQPSVPHPAAPPASATASSAAPTQALPAAPGGEASERTISRDQLPGEATQTVVAARCPDGHLSPAYAGTCRVCGKPLPPQQPVEIPRPPLGVLTLSNGDTVVLDRGCILGRNPRIPPGTSGEQPNLVKLIDPDKDISGQHLEVRLEYWHVAVKDLGSTNGTQVVLPGENPVTLRPNDPMMIEPGTRVILAGVFSFTFEVTP